LRQSIVARLATGTPGGILALSLGTAEAMQLLISLGLEFAGLAAFFNRLLNSVCADSEKITKKSSLAAC